METVKKIKIDGSEPSTGFSIPGDDKAGWHPESVTGLTIRQQFAANAHAAIISNPETLKEITKGMSGVVLKEKETMWLRAVARIAVSHADALIDALNE